MNLLLHQVEPALRRLGLTHTANAVACGRETEAEGWEVFRETYARRLSRLGRRPGGLPLCEDWCTRALAELATANELETTVESRREAA